MSQALLQFWTEITRSSPHSRLLPEQQKKSQSRAPSLSHADSGSVIWATWMWWLWSGWWSYCLQGLKSGVVPHNLKCHNICKSWALPKRTPCVTETCFLVLFCFFLCLCLWLEKPFSDVAIMQNHKEYIFFREFLLLIFIILPDLLWKHIRNNKFFFFK